MPTIFSSIDQKIQHNLGSSTSLDSRLCTWVAFELLDLFDRDDGVDRPVSGTHVTVTLTSTVILILILILIRLVYRDKFMRTEELTKMLFLDLYLINVK